jgi:hypothetical protein
LTAACVAHERRRERERNERSRRGRDGRSLLHRLFVPSFVCLFVRSCLRSYSLYPACSSCCCFIRTIVAMPKSSAACAYNLHVSETLKHTHTQSGDHPPLSTLPALHTFARSHSGTITSHSSTNTSFSIPLPLSPPSSPSVYLRLPNAERCARIEAQLRPAPASHRRGPAAAPHSPASPTPPLS